ncbi:hypothetical protein QJ520_24850, partial [Klebsiella pneumoniae]|nr:hypothetical protein [Klebsiella pneumoniae]
IRCVCGKKIGPDPRNFNQRVSLGRNDLLIRTFPKAKDAWSCPDGVTRYMDVRYRDKAEINKLSTEGK